MSILSQIVGGSSVITGYTQTAVMQTSQSVAVPPGTKRIEALLCGGGSLGGFGGLQIYEIPVTGSTIVLTVGLGSTTWISGETSVVINGAKIAAVGGRFASSGYVGGPPFNKRLLLWSALDEAPRNGNSPGTMVYSYRTTGESGNVFVLPGSAAPSIYYAPNNGTDAVDGYGGSCGNDPGGIATSLVGGKGGAGASGGTGTPSNSQSGSSAGAGGAGGAGGGGGQGGSWQSSYGVLNGTGGVGGSMTWCSVWGLTGFINGVGGVGYSGASSGGGGGGGGGGMLSAGANGAPGTAVGGGLGGNGGNGGGGGGRGIVGATKGGDGFAMFRFYY